MNAKKVSYIYDNASNKKEFMAKNEPNITLKDIAEKLNLGVATVSRAFSNKGNVSKATKQRILQLCQELNYRPNLNARALASKKSRTIGMVLHSLSFWHQESTIRNLEKILREHNYDLQVSFGYGSPDHEVFVIETMISRGVEAVIFNITNTSGRIEALELLIEEGIPFVTIGQSKYDSFSRVDFNWKIAGRTVTSHLIERGYESIAFICEDLHDERNDGYRMALIDNGLTVNQELIFAIPCTMEAAEANIDKILATKCTAIFANSDRMAYYILKSLRKRNIIVPEQIALAGCGNEMYTDVFKPSLTTYEPHREQMAPYLAQEIIESLTVNDKVARTVLISGRLLVRESTAPNRTGTASTTSNP